LDVNTILNSFKTEGFGDARRPRSSRSSSSVRLSSTQSGCLGRNAGRTITQSLAARSIPGRLDFGGAEEVATDGSVEAVIARASAHSSSDGSRRADGFVASVTASTRGFSEGVHYSTTVVGGSDLRARRDITPSMAALLYAAEAEVASRSAYGDSSSAGLEAKRFLRAVTCMEKPTTTKDMAGMDTHPAKKRRVPMSDLDGNAVTKMEEQMGQPRTCPKAAPKQETQTGTNGAAKKMQLNVPVSGRSFIVSLDNGFFEATVIPQSVLNAFEADLMPYVLLFGSTSEPFKVQLKMAEGKCVFAEGWYSFVAAERIVAGDMALFFLRGKNLMDMTLYDSSGCEKPISKRPQNWAPPEAPAEENANANNNPAPAGVAGQAPVPEHVLGMEYELGPRVSISPQLMQFMANIWMFRRHNFPLYAVQLNHSQVHRSIFYFNAQFSYGFPDEVMTVMMSLADQVPSHEGRLKKTDGPTRLLKILKCWGGFAEDHGLQEGHIYIMKFRVVGQVARLKVYPLPGPPAA